MNRRASPPLVLASGSPRRLTLLEQIGITPATVVAAELDETPLKNELPRALACRLALAKAHDVASGHSQAAVLAADTVVACGRRILPKAESEQDARACLKLLSGRRHVVHGGVALALPGGKVMTRYVATRVGFKRLSHAEIETYIACGEWHGKAGGYAIQGRAAAFIPFINGSYSNVVGLPLYETQQLLEGAGLCPS